MQADSILDPDLIKCYWTRKPQGNGIKMQQNSFKWSQLLPKKFPIKTVDSLLYGLSRVIETLSLERQVHMELCNVGEPTLLTVNFSIPEKKEHNAQSYLACVYPFTSHLRAAWTEGLGVDPCHPAIQSPSSPTPSTHIAWGQGLWISYIPLWEGIHFRFSHLSGFDFAKSLQSHLWENLIKKTKQNM